MSNDEKSKNDRLFIVKLILAGVFTYVGLVLILFLLAWRLDYWQAWVYGVIGLIMMISAGIAFRNNSELFKERTKPGPGTKKYDKVMWALFTPAMFVIMIIAPLDAGRFGWTSDLLTPKLLLPIYNFFGLMTDLPWYVYIIGYICFIYAQLLKYWCMWSNKWFSSTVRIQIDRDHQVVDSGPYRYVRHPGYVSGFLVSFGQAIVLGSLWALIPAIMVMIVLIVRTSLEDKTLQKELPGYAEYAKKVRFRLFPGIW